MQERSQRPELVCEREKTPHTRWCQTWVTNSSKLDISNINFCSRNSWNLAFCDQDTSYFVWQLPRSIQSQFHSKHFLCSFKELHSCFMPKSPKQFRHAQWLNCAPLIALHSRFFQKIYSNTKTKRNLNNRCTWYWYKTDMGRNKPWRIFACKRQFAAGNSCCTASRMWV